jgi:glucose-6-phosphate 1-epimerase
VPAGSVYPAQRLGDQTVWSINPSEPEQIYEIIGANTPHQVFGKPTDHAATSALPQHGFARTSRWEFLGKSTTESDGKGGDGGVKLDFGLGPENLSAEAREAWKGEFGLIYSVALTRGALRTSMLVRNDGGEAWEFQVLMHTYLRVKVGLVLSIWDLEGVRE